MTSGHSSLQEIKTLAAEQQNGVLKVVISRGSGGEGTAHRTVDLQRGFSPLLAHPGYHHRLRNEGMTLALSPVRLGRYPHCRY
ncbi:hypothetical protein ACLK1S_06790 [Escherichia coli]